MAATKQQSHSLRGFVQVLSRMKEICFCCCQTLQGLVTHFTAHNSSGHWQAKGGGGRVGEGAARWTHWTPARRVSMTVDEPRSWSCSSGRTSKYLTWFVGGGVGQLSSASDGFRTVGRLVFPSSPF